MVIKEQVFIPFLNQERTLHIYRSDTKIKPTQIIYMFDGHNLFYDHDATYGKSWGLKDYLDSHPCSLMVVGIECNHEGNRRLCEFSPYNFYDSYWKDVTACGKEFSQWIINELIPTIESHYQLSIDSSKRYIGGSSMGGLMALYMGATYPNILTKSICVSPYIDHIYQPLLKDINASLVNNNEFYISFGGKESDNTHNRLRYVEQITSIQSILTYKNNRVFLYSKANGKHCEACWEKETPIWMHYLNIE